MTWVDVSIIFTGATLPEATLHSANIIGFSLSRVTLTKLEDMTQDTFDSAYAEHDNPPRLANSY